MTHINHLALFSGFLLVASSSMTLADHPSAAFGSNQAGPLITIPAATLPASKWSVGFRTEKISVSPLSDAMLEQAALDGEDIHSVDPLTSHFLSLAYGVSNTFTIGLNIPYVSRKGIRKGELHHGAPEVHQHSEADGLGDASILGQYRFDFANTESSQLGVLFGIQLPTGDDDVTDQGSLFEAEFQPGSGAWHPMIGMTFSKRIATGSIDANFLYLHTREGTQQSRTGNLLQYNIAWSYRFDSESPVDNDLHDHASHIHVAWDAIIELNGELRGKNETNNHTAAHSGGNLIYLSPGVRLTIADKWNMHASIGIPVLDNSNGTQADVDYRANIGLGLSL